MENARPSAPALVTEEEHGHMADGTPLRKSQKEDIRHSTQVRLLPCLFLPLAHLLPEPAAPASMVIPTFFAALSPPASLFLADLGCWGAGCEPKESAAAAEAARVCCALWCVGCFLPDPPTFSDKERRNDIRFILSMVPFLSSSLPRYKNRTPGSRQQ